MRVGRPSGLSVLHGALATATGRSRLSCTGAWPRRVVQPSPLCGHTAVAHSDRSEHHVRKPCSVRVLTFGSAPPPSPPCGRGQERSTHQSGPIKVGPQRLAPSRLQGLRRSRVFGFRSLSGVTRLRIQLPSTVDLQTSRNKTVGVDIRKSEMITNALTTPNLKVHWISERSASNIEQLDVPGNPNSETLDKTGIRLDHVCYDSTCPRGVGTDAGGHSKWGKLDFCFLLHPHLRMLHVFDLGISDSEIIFVPGRSCGARNSNT